MNDIEFGLFIDSGKLIYGRPSLSPKNQYLDWIYRDRKLGKIHDNMITLAREAVQRLGRGLPRQGAERKIPMNLWKMASVEDWYENKVRTGCVLDNVRMLWSRSVENKPKAVAIEAVFRIDGRVETEEIILIDSDNSIQHSIV